MVDTPLTIIQGQGDTPLLPVQGQGDTSLLPDASNVPLDLTFDDRLNQVVADKLVALGITQLTAPGTDDGIAINSGKIELEIGTLPPLP